MKTKRKQEQVYSDTKTKELKEVLNKNRQINKNLDNYVVSNFWTQPYQDLGSKQAIDLGANLVKESLYTGVGEAVLKVIPGLLKNIRASRLKNSIKTLEQTGIDITDPNIDIIRNQAKEATKYITSPELRNQLTKIDQEFGTYYVEALDQYLDHYAKTGKLLKINYDANYPQGGITIHNASNILDPSKQVINLGNQFRSSTIEHEFKHNLEYMEAVIRAKHNNLPLTNENILKIRKEQNYYEPLDIFYNFIKDKMQFVKDWSKYKYLGLPINNENTNNE